MRKCYFFVLLVVFVFGCKTLPKEKSQLQLRFLDEYVYPVNKTFKDTKIGGLSGIAYEEGTYFLAVDDAYNPRFYKANIEIVNNKIDTVKFTDVVFFDKKEENFYANNHLDLESIVVYNDKLIISSEGRIYKEKNPFIFQVNKKGKLEKVFEISDKFLSTSIQRPRNNGMFESLSLSSDGKYLWSATEFSLELDGEMAQFPSTNSPIRFSKYSLNLYKPVEEYVYELDPLSRNFKGENNLNGITDILEYKKNHFLVMERSYQSGYKNNENGLKIFEAIITPKTTNSSSVSFLSKEKYIPMKKRLVFDLENYKDQLTDQLIDNLEGITFGPKLPNGNQSIILVSDDNFQRYGKQLNQFLLLEMIN